MYALGLYVDEKATQKVLKAQFPGAEATALSKDQSLCEGKKKPLICVSGSHSSVNHTILVLGSEQPARDIGIIIMAIKSQSKCVFFLQK